MGGKAKTTDAYTAFGKEIERQLEALRGKPFVKTGFPEDKFSKQHGDENARGEKTVGYIATVHEFGSRDGRVPERSFIRSTTDKQRHAWEQMTKTLRKQVMAGKMTIEKALGLLGEQMVADMRSMIKSGIPPPLALSTIEGRLKRSGKGFSSIGENSMIPLMDTDQMLNELSKKVFMKGSDR